MGTPTRKLGRFIMPLYKIDVAPDPPNIPWVMFATDVTKFEGVIVGIGINATVCRNVGMLATIMDSFPDPATAMAHP